MKKLAMKLVIAAIIISATTIRGGQAEEALTDMRTAWKSVQTYTVTLISHQEADSKTSSSTVNVSYKSPGWLKIDVTEGDNKGSSAVYDPGKDKIQVKWAGIALPVFLSPDAKAAKSLRGEKIYSVTFGNMLNHADFYIANGSLSWIGEETFDGKACAVIEFKTTKPEANLGIVRERWWLDKGSGLPRRVQCFDSNGTKVQWTIYRNLKLNPQLSSEHFKL